MTERAYLTEIASRQCCRKAFSHNQDPKETLQAANYCIARATTQLLT